MTLSSGTTLAHYEILGPLGKGGMGEVWRAKDTKLGREVAIKVLPPENRKTNRLLPETAFSGTIAEQREAMMAKCGFVRGDSGRIE